MTYTAFVPARAGSKRLPNKNIRPLHGKPLVLWTLEACLNARSVDKVILSTDSMDYWELVTKACPSDKLALDLRTDEDAGDQVKIFDYLKQSHQKIFGSANGNFILALPTVPLRSAAHLEEAIALFEKHRQPVFSATEYTFPVSFAFTLDREDNWHPMFQDSPMLTGNTRSQNQQVAYRPNGAIYVRAIADLARPELVTLYQGARAYLMDHRDSVDIDGELDFAIASALVSLRGG